MAERKTMPRPDAGVWPDGAQMFAETLDGDFQVIYVATALWRNPDGSWAGLAYEDTMATLRGAVLRTGEDLDARFACKEKAAP